VSDVDDSASGRFDLHDEDVPKLIELCKVVRQRLSKLKPTRVTDARVGECDLKALPNFREIVDRLIGYLSPFVHEIAAHSLEPDELVLRRLLADNRREEIFVSKTTLRGKYDHLPAELRVPFLPLGLHTPLSRSMPPGAQPSELVTSRSELPPSNPPPPPARLPPPPIAPRLPQSPNPPASISRAAAVSAPASPRLGPAAVQTSSPVSPPSDAGATVQEPADGAGKATLAPSLKKALELGKLGQLSEAFLECALVLEGAAFPGHPPMEQRHALRLLFVLERPTAPSDAVRRAQRAGKRRASALVEQFGDPADYELLGLCQAALEEPTAAAESFKKGLELERARNPNSDLCARLTKHAS
jgi:hypothetical protein